MVLAGVALAFSRLIFNAVVVLENIYRHMEMGESAEAAAEVGGQEVAQPVLAATIASAVIFFPVSFPVRRVAVPLRRAGARGRPLAHRVVRRRDDGRAALLRASC